MSKATNNTRGPDESSPSLAEVSGFVGVRLHVAEGMAVNYGKGSAFVKTGGFHP